MFLITNYKSISILIKCETQNLNVFLKYLYVIKIKC